MTCLRNISIWKMNNKALKKNDSLYFYFIKTQELTLSKIIISVKHNFICLYWVPPPSRAVKIYAKLLICRVICDRYGCKQ
ncbi:hypothetical protein QTP88_001589 [Uroleucon formosanum]